MRLFQLLPGRCRALGDFDSVAAAAQETPAGAYTTLRTWSSGRRVLRFGQHLERLEESTGRLGRPGSLDRARVASALGAALDTLGGGERRVRLTFAPPALYASLEPFTPPSGDARRDGVACAIVSGRRADARCKDTRFAEQARELAAALPVGVHEGLMLGDDGAILEGLSSNFFAVRDGVLRTVGEGALPGLTRALVLELARGRLPIELRAVHRDEIDSLSEAFITSTSRGVLPVVRIEGRAVGDARPGPVTRDLIRDFEARVESELESLEDLARG